VISTFLVQYPWITTVALVTVVVIGPLLGSWLVDRRPLNRWLAGIVAVAVLVITLYPESRTPAPGCQVSWMLPTLGAVELIANIILFVVPVLLVGVATRHPLAAFAAGTLASVLIEVVQAAVPALGRSCDTGDWLQNTIGALIGALLAALALRLSRKRPTRRSPSSGSR